MDMPTIESTWARRELPILAAALRRLDSGEQRSLQQLEEIRQELDLTPKDLAAGIEALESADPPYIEVEVAGGWTDERAGGGFVVSVSERARRELGSWPSAESLVEQLAAALSRAADDEPEPERKGRLRDAAEVLASTARDIAVGVISTKIGRL